MTDSDTSLYSNLTQCIRALRKIRDLYKTAPPIITEHLANTEEVIALCQCAALEDDEGDPPAILVSPPVRTSKTYWYILENLIEVSTPRRLLLQLYFCKSPYWEHYDRNMTEIMILLDKIIYSRRVNTSMGSSSGGDDSNDGGRRFERKFVPFPKVVMDRQWAGNGWKARSPIV